MKKQLLALALMAMALVATGANAEEQRGTDAQGRPFFKATEKVTVTSTVIGLDKNTRVVTLKGERGDTVAIKCGSEVKNFAQIKVGDTVKMSYTEQLDISIEDPGKAAVSAEASTGSAKVGDMPAASATTKTQYKAEITAINLENGTATLKGVDGDQFLVSPLYPENLKKVKVGEIVVFTTTETIAVKVERVAPPKKK
jgi:hypothetical protein